MTTRRVESNTSNVWFLIRTCLFAADSCVYIFICGCVCVCTIWSPPTLPAFDSSPPHRYQQQHHHPRHPWTSPFLPASTASCSESRVIVNRVSDLLRVRKLFVCFSNLLFIQDPFFFLLQNPILLFVQPPSFFPSESWSTIRSTCIFF